MSFISQLSWRFATKSFDATKKVAKADISQIVEAARMAPTSYGLQPFHLYVISNTEIQKKLQTASYNQSQVADAPYYLVFTARTDIETRAQEYVQALSGGDAEAEKNLSGLKNMIVGSVADKTQAEKTAWAAKQAYIALGFSLAAAAELAIDSCPMEGFDPQEYAKILELPASEMPVVALAVGYRKEGPERLKFRFPASEMITNK